VTAMEKEQLKSVLTVFIPSVVAWFSAKGLIASDMVGPGSTELTVTAVPAVICARPRATEICADLVMP